MKSQNKQTILIFGTGLIGGSFAKALHEKYNIIGVDKIQHGSDIFINQYDINDIDNVKNAIQSSDVIFICANLSGYQEIANILTSANTKDKEVFEFGSVKLFPQIALKNIPNLTLCHPIAGSEKSGFCASSSDLFENKTLLVSKENSTIKQIANQCNFEKISIIDNTLHDKIYAKTSHFPQMIMFLLGDFMQTHCPTSHNFSPYNEFRLMNSSEKIWFGEFGILSLNINNIEQSVADFLNHIKPKTSSDLLIELQTYLTLSTEKIREHRGSGINDIINANFSSYPIANIKSEKFIAFLESINFEEYAKKRYY